MKNPLDSVGTTVTLGVVFAILVMVLPITPGGEFQHLGLGRWGHIVSGIFWIGLLYYFNVVQIPAWPPRTPTRAARAVRASSNTSRRARCSGSAGRRGHLVDRRLDTSAATS